MDGPPGHAYDIYVDGKARAGVQLRTGKGGWGSVVSGALQGSGTARVALAKGTRLISICGRSPAVPNIEEFVAAREERDARYPEQPHQDYLKYIRVAAPPGTVEGKAKSASPALAKQAAENPLITWFYQIQTPLLYTYTSNFYLNANVTVTFHTANKSGQYVDPVMHFFNEANAVNQTWTDDDGGGDHNCKLTVKIPTTGWYRLVIHNFGIITGTVDLYMNGALYSPAAVSGGSLIDMGATTPGGNLNYFTAKYTPGGDPRIFLLRNYLGHIVAANDDGPGAGGDWVWGYNPRLNGSYGNVNTTLISNFSSTPTPPYPLADLYMKVPNGVAHTYKDENGKLVFPGLKAGDAMKTAPTTQNVPGGGYNCAAWAGGVTSSWAWPPQPGNPWYVAGNGLQSLINYYSNTCASGGVCKRYADSYIWKYAFQGDNAANAVLAVWKNLNSGQYTHVSVATPANNLPHGYDWESKPGKGERTLHPQHALYNQTLPNGYGGIVHYFIKSGYTAKVSATGMAAPEISTEAESIQKGLSVLEAPEDFSVDQVAKLARLAGSGKADQLEFNRLMGAWKATFSDPGLMVQSNPEAYRRSDAYAKLAAFSRSKGKAVWPHLLAELRGRDPIVGAAVIDLVLPGKESVLDGVVMDWNANQVRADGKFSIFSPENTRIRFAKRLLEEI
jgi:hypothetical protein